MSSTGETSLATLLSSMSPTLDETHTYVFGTIPAKSESDYSNILKLFVGLPVQMLFRESEGWTVIVAKETAEEIQMQYEFPCKKITLNVHSSLEAVGFMAAITTRLKEVGVGVNPVSGYYHDHLFVPEGKDGEVMVALKRMVEEAKEGV
jgi:hypothetical protein